MKNGSALMSAITYCHPRQNSWTYRLKFEDLYGRVLYQQTSDLCRDWINAVHQLQALIAISTPYLTDDELAAVRQELRLFSSPFNTDHYLNLRVAENSQGLRSLSVAHAKIRTAIGAPRIVNLPDLNAVSLYAPDLYSSSGPDLLDLIPF